MAVADESRQQGGTLDWVMIYVREVVAPWSGEGLQMKLKFFAISQREEFWLNRAIRYSLRQEEA